MKKITLFFVAIMLFSTVIYSQVAINKDGTPPDASAMLDVKSTEGGLLIPRMTAAQRDAISSPASGLMVYVTDDDTFYYYDGSAWSYITGNNAEWIVNGNDMYTVISGNVGIGTSTPETTAKLDVVSTTSGFLPPRLTTAQRDAIVNPAAGLMVFNITTNCLDFFNGTIWVANCQSNMDTDGDGLPDYAETGDSDGDGIMDYLEHNYEDTDNDGINDYLDTDSDGDGILDGVEGAVADNDSDGVPDILESNTGDADGDGNADWDDIDSDNDGIGDNTEGYYSDTDNDGVLDRDESNTLDFDGDGSADYQDTDSDGDALSDGDEGSFDDNDGDNIVDRDEHNLFDTDIDGTYDWNDTDSDGDGINDGSEGFDTDTDSDGVVDRLEHNSFDSDSDGTNDYQDSDADGDGVNDGFEKAFTDSDSDGIVDRIESNVEDTDGDGTNDYLDTDSDGDANLDGDEGVVVDTDTDGVPDRLESNIGDADGDGNMDYNDTDSDNDGVDDDAEGWYADTDSDGVLDRDESNTLDFDTDGSADYLDSDSDGDGTDDGSEGTFSDNDGDGIVDRDESNTFDTDSDTYMDWNDTDCDGDGTSDGSEGLATDSDSDGVVDRLESNSFDNDGDGTPDYLDSDSDDDAILDGTEGSFVDSDWDNIPNRLESNIFDTDGDTSFDFQDMNADGDAIIDMLEPYLDTDGDGVPDRLEHNTSDNDMDGDPDYADTDADNDGIDDASEGFYSDTDNDGVVDRLESNIWDTDGDTPYDYNDTDADGDARLDSMEGIFQDTDGDGVIDRLEMFNVDTDGDGWMDWLDLDSDGDGRSDGEEGTYTDANGNGVLDRLEVTEPSTAVCGTIIPYNEVTNSTTEEVWLDRNLGASQVATAYNDYQAYGSLYQWGRLSDDHECINWTGSTTGNPSNGSTSAQSANDDPGHSNFITNSSDWRNPRNDNLWQGVDGINNPCPNGYRLPSNNEWNDERASWATNNSAGAYGSELKLTTPGYRHYTNASLVSTGSYGYYWSSTIYGTYARGLYFYASSAAVSYWQRSYGFSVRCIKDGAATDTIQETSCGSTLDYHEVESDGTSEIWLDRNLGASQVATSVTDHLAYGSLYQWGRLSDDHECMNWTGGTTGSPVNGTTSTQSTTDDPGHNNFITNSYDWRNPSNSALWQGVNGTNNPCPSGFRLPTFTELWAERNAWSSSNAAGAYQSSLKFVTPGYRAPTTGVPASIGSYGYYWTSTAYDANRNYVVYIYGSSTYSYYYRSYGFSVRCIKDESVSSCGGSYSYNEVTNDATGEVWLDRNLGASQVATSSDDYKAYGSSYQWGRLSDGHECMNWISSTEVLFPNTSTTSTLSSTDDPGHSDFITGTDWRSPGNNNLWQGTNGTNNPCPSGFRIPSRNELNAERNSWSSNNSAGAFASDLKFTTPGYRSRSNGAISYPASYGYYWSSTVSGSNQAYALSFYASGGSESANYRAHGFSVRCIKDNASTNPISQTDCGTSNTYYEVESDGTSEIWLDRNLGASQVATSVTDHLAYGSLYQWGRLSDDHECMNWTGGTTGSPVNGTTSTQSTTDDPGHNNFITNSYDWRNPSNSALWQGVNGTNNPCPSGFRLPTFTELWAERNAWSSSNAAGAYQSSLKFVTPGYRAPTTGVPASIGSYGYYWTSTAYDANRNYVVYIYGSSNYSYYYRSYGFSVRCIKDESVSSCDTPSYGEVTNSITGDTWLDRNLGASQIAATSTDYKSYGSQYQWGRLSDGHECVNWISSTEGLFPDNSTTSTQSSTDVPGHDDFIMSSDWRNPYNNNLWQGANGINNPCPSGFRLPTNNELTDERTSWSTNNAAGALGSVLKLPMAGYRNYSGGALAYPSTYGYYWSATIYSTNRAYILYFNSSSAGNSYQYRGYGSSVRCIKDESVQTCNSNTYNNVTNPVTGEIWQDRNLGASRVATSSDDFKAYGSLYQWGRLSDGHQCVTWLNHEDGMFPNTSTTSTASLTDDPGHDDFITVADWRSGGNNDLWQGVNGINNPCASGYRLPTNNELNSERNSWGSNNSDGAFASPLKFTTAGYRAYNTGVLTYVGSYGYYWSSTIYSSNQARSFYFYASSAANTTNYRGYGFSVRCIKDVASQYPITHTTCGNSYSYYEVENGETGEIWLDRNLGASQVATSYDDYNAYGSLYQWGRLSDGHQCITYTSGTSGTPNSSTTAGQSSTDDPGTSRFIYGSYDWRNPSNDNLWQGASGINNPCPSGFRLPTNSELTSERTSWVSNNAAGAYQSPLKFTTPGRRNYSNTNLEYVGSYGYYWSSTVYGTNQAYAMYNGGNSNYYRAYGNSVRCIKD